MHIFGMIYNIEQFPNKLKDTWLDYKLVSGVAEFPNYNVMTGSFLKRVSTDFANFYEIKGFMT